MFKKTVAFVVSLLVWTLLISALIGLFKAPVLKELRETVKEKSKIVFNNLADTFSPPRRPPLTTIELEENLKANLAVPFAKFTQEDWQWFWNLCYGRYMQDSGAWPRRKRQLTREEVQNVLADNYRPFSRFTQQQWSIFWQHVLKGTVFKR